MPQLSKRFEVGRDIPKVDGMFYFIYFIFFLSVFVMIAAFSPFYHQFPAGENFQIVGNITGQGHLLTTTTSVASVHFSGFKLTTSM